MDTITTIEGEVLAYEGASYAIVRTSDNRALRVPIPGGESYLFDTVPPRSLYDDGTPGASISLDILLKKNRVHCNNIVGMRVKGNAPGATWRKLR